MRSLIIIETLKYPPRLNGRSVRTKLFIDAISTLFDQVDFLLFAPPEAAQQPVDNNAVKDIWGVSGTLTLVPMRMVPFNFHQHYIAGLLSAEQETSFAPFCGPDQIAAVKAALATKPDLVFVVQTRTMAAVLAAGWSGKLLLDMDDILHRVKWRTAMAKPLQRWRALKLLHLPALIATEIRACLTSSAIAVCSTPDRARIAMMGAGRRAVAIPNAIKAPANVPSLPADLTVMYIGDLLYEPNRVAAKRLITRVWPLIRARHPTARLLIAGQGGETIIQNYAPENGVEILGFVDDLAALYAATTVICCPLTIGGGTRVKLIEAASYGRAIVSTRIGAEGLLFADGTEIVLRDTDEDLADACSELLSDPDRCRTLGDAARARMLAAYDAGAVQRKIVEVIKSICPDVAQH